VEDRPGNTAAIYAAGANLNPLVFERHPIRWAPTGWWLLLTPSRPEYVSKGNDR
jgi:flavin-dependent dehydrogenase